MSVKIFVTTIKNYGHILSNGIYIPLQVGRRGGEPTDYIGDDTGENISEKDIYTELRGQYWYWKNVKCDYVGLVHYRRYFPKSNLFPSLISEDGFETVMDEDDIHHYMKDYDIIVLKVYFSNGTSMRNYAKSQNYDKYLELAGEAVKDLTPDYFESFLSVMESNEIFPNNMYITSKKLSDSYSEWVFKILEETEKRLARYEHHDRIMGCITEVLLKAWVLRNNLRAKLMTRLKTDEEWVQYKPMFAGAEPYRVSFEATRDGHDVLRLQSAGSALYMGSKYYLKNDTDALFDRLDGKSFSGIIILGLGSGDYLEAVLNEISNVPIVVLEPDTAVIKRFIELRKYRGLGAYDGRLKIIPFDSSVTDKIRNSVSFNGGFIFTHFTNYDKAYAREFMMMHGFMKLSGNM